MASSLPASSLLAQGAAASSLAAAPSSLAAPPAGRVARSRLAGPQTSATELSYRAASAFSPAKLQSTSPLPHVSLIKVPPFVAAAWHAAEKQSVVGVLYTDPQTKKKCILGSVAEKKRRRSSADAGVAGAAPPFEAGRGGAGDETHGERRPAGGRGTGAAAAAPVCHLQCVSVKPNKLHVLQQQSGPGFPAAADVLCVVGESSNFAPLLDDAYQSFLRRRHESIDIFKSRGTIEEKRRETGLDSTATLFHFHTPKPGPNASGVVEEEDEFSLLGGRRGGMSAAEAARTRTAKQKKAVVTMDEDSLKLRLFSIFEAAGANGLQLKQIAMQTGQPLSFVRQVVEEIAEPRKRASDRKTVYFLKDQFNPYASLAGEEPLMKKPKLP